MKPPGSRPRSCADNSADMRPVGDSPQIIEPPAKKPTKTGTWGTADDRVGRGKKSSIADIYDCIEDLFAVERRKLFARIGERWCFRCGSTHPVEGLCQCESKAT